MSETFGDGDTPAMWPGFVSRGPTVGEAEVAAFEARCGFRLPPDYRRFLQEHNGGERAPAPRAEEEGVGDWVPQPRRVYSLGAAAAAGLSVEDALVLYGQARWAEDWAALMEFPELTGDLEVQMRLCRGDGGPGYYPPELLPVADGDHDDLLLLRLDGSDIGAVYFSYDPDGYCEWHCHRVAESFAELLRDLGK
ncbi:MAG: SMI1/KNR4 family protein [Gemmataceae bacterium]